MFSDIKDQSLNKIPMSDAKAYPSVNSPNGGGFNSEENLRWLTKKLATKPFIVGANDDEVNNAFGSNGEAGDGIYIKPGMFSIDGYVFKFAEPEEISFDNDGETTFMMMNTQMIQRFVQQLTNQGTSQTIVTDMTLFMFNDYNPSVTTDETTLKANWKEAYENGDCVGYIWNYYNGDYKNELTVSENKISYLTGDKIDYVNNSELYNNPTISSINTFLNGHSDLNGKPFAIPNNTTTATSYAIFYPLYFKDVKKWNKITSKYVVKQQLQFTDIFGLLFVYNDGSPNLGLGYGEHCQTRSYPVTTSVYMDMNENKPFTNFDDCDALTYSQKYYDYTKLYNAETSLRPDPTTLGTDYPDYEDISVNSMPLPENIKNSNNQNIFTKVLINNNGNPTTSAQSIPENSTIRDTLSYYCLTNLPTIPSGMSVYNVAFMTSDGSLCPNGLRYFDENGKLSFGTTGSGSIEGYLHFCKRWYLYNNGQGTENETTINNVSVQTLLLNPAFITMYNTYIAPAISVYIQIIYSSIMENVFLNSANTDAKKIKAMGSGNALIDDQVAGVTERNFYADFEYTYPQYVKNSNSFSNTQTIIQVHRDINSDCEKSNRLVLGDAYIRVADNQTPSNFCYYKKPDALIGHTERIPYFVDDPLNYLRKCVCSSTYTEPKINGFTFYKINSNTFKLDSGSDITDNNYMMLDQYLMPANVGYNNVAIKSKVLEDGILCATFATHVMVSVGTGLQESSLINGLCAEWKQNCWFTEIPLTMRVDKDSLNYLKSKDFTDPNYYKGIIFEYKFPQDLLDTDLYLYNLVISTTNIISAYDLETCTRQEDTTSSKVKHRRESFIHFNKLYGDDYISLEDFVESIVNQEILPVETNISNLTETVSTLSTDVSHCPKVLDRFSYSYQGSIDANNYIETTRTLNIPDLVSPYPVFPCTFVSRLQTNTNTFNDNIKIDTYIEQDESVTPYTKTLYIRIVNTSNSQITFDYQHQLILLVTTIV